MDAFRSKQSILVCGSFQLKVMSLKTLIQKFENNGAVNISVIEHNIENDQRGNLSLTSNGPVCFALDTLKERKRQKARRPTPQPQHVLLHGCQATTGNALTFGARVDLAKLRCSSNLLVA